MSSIYRIFKKGKIYQLFHHYRNQNKMLKESDSKTVKMSLTVSTVSEVRMLTKIGFSQLMCLLELIAKSLERARLPGASKVKRI